MPEIGLIQATNFQALLTQLGITRNNLPFALRSEVTPVVLVGGTVSFIAASTPAYGVTDVFTAGLLTAPAINTIMADTGALPVGSYTLQLFYYVEIDDATFELQWRNAANSANLATQRFRLFGPPGANPGVNNLVLSTRYNIENASERFRVQLMEAGGVGQDNQATIQAKI